MVERNYWSSWFIRTHLRIYGPESNWVSCMHMQWHKHIRSFSNQIWLIWVLSDKRTIHRYVKHLRDLVLQAKCNQRIEYVSIWNGTRGMIFLGVSIHFSYGRPLCRNLYLFSWNDHRSSLDPLKEYSHSSMCSSTSFVSVAWSCDLLHCMTL